MKIAFIGLGIMGKPMAKNLIKAGHELFVFDRNPAANEEMKAAGANICASSADTVKNVDLVITMLPNSPQVKSVMLEEDKLADAMPKTAVFIDCSSINPVASREIAAELEKRGIDMLDAPVSGGQPKAIDGTLSFMVGGKEEVFNRFKPVLASMGSSVVLCGGILGRHFVQEIAVVALVRRNGKLPSGQNPLDDHFGTSFERVVHLVVDLVDQREVKQHGPCRQKQRQRPRKVQQDAVNQFHGCTSL